MSAPGKKRTRRGAAPRERLPGRQAGRLPGKRMARAFFLPSVETVAPRLLGKLLVRRLNSGGAGGRWLAGRIVEVEAYLGPHHETADPAAHSYRGVTPRNRVMFGEPGHAYVYQIYGQYFCMNVTCEPDGQAGCVLVRALEPVMGISGMAANRGLDEDAPARMLTSGPSRLCQALGLTKAEHNGLDLLDPASPLQLRDDGFEVTEARVTVRIGLRHAAELPLRFALDGNEFVSGSRRLGASGSIWRAKPTLH